MWSVRRSAPSLGRTLAVAVGVALAGTLGVPGARSLGVGQTPASALTPAQATAGSATVHPYEYVFQPGVMYVYDMDDEQKLVQEATGLPDADGVRGAMVDPATDRLYISHGGDGPSGSFDGSLLAYDLVSEAQLWNRSYPFSVDSGAITPDGATIYMPTGENDPSGIWNVLRASDGEPIGSIHGGTSAHNTIVSLDGKYVFLGGRDYDYLDVASTATNDVVEKIGPLAGGVRPFTINGAHTLAYTTATEFLGFQVSSIVTGKVLYTVEFPGLPPDFHLSPPSHGITLTPDEQQLYVIDTPHESVHVFDVSKVPASAPVQIAEIKLSSMAGNEEPCVYDCAKSGWLQASRDGRFVYVGDSGDVIDTHTLKIVKTLPTLAQTRQMLEIDWADGVPVATTSRYGLGYVSGAPGEPTAPETQNELPEVVSAGTSASASAGTSPPLSPPALVSSMSGELRAAAPAARIEGLRMVPAVVKAAGSDARVSYTDSVGARAEFTVSRAGRGVQGGGHRCLRRVSHTPAPVRKRCTAYRLSATFVHNDRVGMNALRFSADIAGRRLEPGRYRLRVLPVFDGRAGVGQAVDFRVLD